ncbi:MAG: pyruvate dehydrogenase (acetyl-transferring) E1 component subunit alpha [Alphaproteobacteria bacterium]|nr:MAG: pyruvate dehydrogenase (acetyl-transferring) E1 component subunit alpha [Alphaproteobacteria bacterium]
MADEGLPVVARFEVRQRSYLAPDGTVLRPLPDFASDIPKLLALYRGMVLTRAFDLKAVSLQRTGRLGTYAVSLGQEAVAVGIASAMRQEDVLLPSYRDNGTLLWRGTKMEEILLFWGGDERGNLSSGPAHDFPYCIPVGSQAPQAAGVAYAFKLRKEPRVAVCLFGDGATSKGDVWEAMNFAGVHKLPLLFVANNNQWAISVPLKLQTASQTLAQKAIAAGFTGEQVDGNDVIAVRAAAEEAIAQARAGGGPRLIEALTYRLSDHTTADDAARYRSPEEVQTRWKEEPIARLRAYLVSQKAWGKAQEEELAAECQKEIEAAIERYLASSPRAPETMFDHLYARASERSSAEARMPELTLIEAINLALARAMQEDANVVVLGEDVGVNGGVFRATVGLQQRFGAERVIDTPLAELLISGLCVGMAAQGLKPVGEIQFMGFIYPCIDQLVNHASRLRNRTQGRLSCPMVLRTPHGGGIRAPEHHSESTEAMLAHIPGLRVVMPSSPERAYGLLLASIRDPDPVVFLEPTRIYRAAKGQVEDNGEALPLDIAFVLRQGHDVTLISWGAVVKETLAAAAELAGQGIEAEVIDLATLKPYDEETVLASVTKTGRCVIVHEAARTGGFGAEIAALIAERGLTSLLAPVARVTGYDTIMPLPRLEQRYIPSVPRIVAATRKACEFA